MHKLGNFIEDLKTMGGAILDGLSMTCSNCKGVCVIKAPKGRFTRQEHMHPNYWCPYCGFNDDVQVPENVRDIRPTFPDE